MSPGLLPTRSLLSPLAGVEPEFADFDHQVWVDIRPRAGKPGFVPAEFAVDGGDAELMDVAFLELLYDIRQDIHQATAAAGFPDVPMRIISAARASGGATRSAHVVTRPCRAVDVQVFNAYDRGVITLAAIRRGIVRWGTYPGERVNDQWRDKAGLHLDASTDARNPSPRNWTRY